MLTIREYKRLRLEESMTDSEILQALHYSPTYRAVLQRWKKENGIPLGKSKTHLLDAQAVWEYLKDHSMLETATHFGVDLRALYRWEKEQRNSN